jgi:serine protease Do
MKHFSRLVSKASSLTALGSVLGSAALVPAACAAQLLGVMPDSSALLLRSSQGYLGVEMRDIDADRASTLKLKDATGAEITYIDHDAPAGKVGLRIHDVILQMNGQQVQGVEQLRRMLRETPAGRSVTLLVWRDGQQQTINVQLADRAKVEQDAWSRHMVVTDPDEGPDTAVVVPPTHGSGGGNSFLGAIVLGSPSIGVDVDPLGSQLADYFGVKDGQGLLVKHVAENSPASTAGFKAGDVITKVNGESMPTLNIWYHALHANRGKQMQVTIVRNRKEQTLSLQAGDPKHKGELEWPEIELGPMHLIEPGELEPEIERNLAQLDSNLDPELLAQQPISEIDAEKLAEQAREAARMLNDERLQQQLRKLGRDLESLSLSSDHHDTF